MTDSINLRTRAGPSQSKRLSCYSCVRATASRNSLHGRNTGAARGGTGTSSPVRGLRPVRAARSLTVNVPNPRSCTLRCCSRLMTTDARNPSMTACVAVRVNPMRSAISFARSAFVTFLSESVLMRNFPRRTMQVRSRRAYEDVSHASGQAVRNSQRRTVPEQRRFSEYAIEKPLSRRWRANDRRIVVQPAYATR